MQKSMEYSKDLFQAVPLIPLNLGIDKSLYGGIISIFSETNDLEQSQKFIPSSSFVASLPLRIIIKEQLKNMSARNLVEKIKYDVNKQYKASDILKNSTYCQNPIKDAENVKKIFTNLDQLEHYPSALVYNAMALSMLDNSSMLSGTKIFVGHEDGNEVNSVSLDFTQTIGAYLPLENVIYLSNIKDSKHDLGIIIHEASHKLRFLFKKYDNDDIDNAMQKIRDYFNNNEISDKDDAASNIKTCIVDKVDYALSMRLSQDLIREETVADIARLMVYAELNPTERDRIYNVAKPLIQYFEEKVLPRIETFILENKNFRMLDIPENLSLSLRKSKTFHSIESKKELSHVASIRTIAGLPTFLEQEVYSNVLRNIAPSKELCTTQ